jgi:hypothetical protein
MAKNDYVTVKSEIGGKLESTTVKVTQNGGDLEVKHERDGKVIITLLNRNKRPTGLTHTFFPGSVRSIEEKLTRE